MQFERGLTDIAQRQLPFAMSQALNDAAKDGAEAIVDHLRARLDRPTPFTLRGTYVKRSSKRKLTAIVGIKDIQAEYLGRLDTGGVRRPRGRALLVPVDARLNKYGNLSRGAMQRLTKRKNVFVGRVKGVGGVWQRPSKRAKPGAAPKLLVRFTDRAEYERQLDVERAVERAVRAGFPRHLVRRLTAAMTAAR